LKKITISIIKMTLFKDTIQPKKLMGDDPEEFAEITFNCTYVNFTNTISEDNGETICGRSLIMLISEMSSRIDDLQYEINKLNGEYSNDY